MFYRGNQLWTDNKPKHTSRKYRTDIYRPGNNINVNRKTLYFFLRLQSINYMF